MKKFTLIRLFLCGSLALIALFVWVDPSEIRHYTAEELVGSTCEELGEKHEEVIFAYHDAEIAHYKRTGAFHDDVGLPKKEVLPYEILIGHFIQANDLKEAYLSENSSILIRKLRYNFFAETTRICATNPMLQAVDAIHKAATNLNLINEPKG